MSTTTIVQQWGDDGPWSVQLTVTGTDLTGDDIKALGGHTVRIVHQEGVDGLPFVHTVIPAYWRTPSGLDVVCNGPHLLALDDNGQPICADCNTPVAREAAP